MTVLYSGKKTINRNKSKKIMTLDSDDDLNKIKQSTMIKIRRTIFRAVFKRVVT